MSPKTKCLLLLKRTVFVVCLGVLAAASPAIADCGQSSVTAVDTDTWIVNLDAKDMQASPYPDPDLPITLSLPAGYYEITPINGTYTAQSYDSSANDGWFYMYKVFVGDSDVMCNFSSYVALCDSEVGQEVVYEEVGSQASASAALAAASVQNFTLNSAADVQITFARTDSNPCDNVGGLSLQVDKIPQNTPTPTPTATATSTPTSTPTTTPLTDYYPIDQAGTTVGL